MQLPKTQLFFYFFTLSFFTSCHFKEKSSSLPAKDVSAHLSQEAEQEIYPFLLSAIEDFKNKQSKPIDLFECQCRSGFKRQLEHIEDNLRFDLDRKALEYLFPLKSQTNKLNLFFFGSGKLMQELTVIARLAQAGFSIKAHIMDNFYAFYSDKDFEDKIRRFKENPQEIKPEWLKDFRWIWNSENMSADEAVALFKEHNQAIDQFKFIAEKLSQKYQVSIDLQIYSNDEEARRHMNSEIIHGYFAIDAFLPPMAIAWRISHDLLNGTARFAGNQGPYELLFFLLNKDRYGLWLEEDDKKDAPTRFDVWHASADFDKEIKLKIIYRKVDEGGRSASGLYLTSHPYHHSH